jgi:hypothetical protein
VRALDLTGRPGRPHEVGGESAFEAIDETSSRHAGAM